MEGNVSKSLWFQNLAKLKTSKPLGTGVKEQVVTQMMGKLPAPKMSLSNNYMCVCVCV